MSDISKKFCLTVFLGLSVVWSSYSQSSADIGNGSIVSVQIGGKVYTMESNGDMLSVTAAATGTGTASVFSEKEGNISVWQGVNFPSVFYFPINRYTLLRDYRYNGIMLDALDEMIAQPQTVQNIDTVEIIGACSPVAGEDYNIKLALSRCMALRSYIRWKHLEFAESVPIKFDIIGIDRTGYNILKWQIPPLSEKEIWDMLQYAAIRLKMKDGTHIILGSDKPKPVKFSPVPYAGGVIQNGKKTYPPATVHNTPVVVHDSLVVVRDPPVTVHDTVYQKYTVYVRDTVVVVNSYGLPPDTLIRCDTVYLTRWLQPEQKAKAPVYFALKTNLIYDAALLPNLTAEFYLGKQWSLAVEGNWSWWTFDKPKQNRWYHRIQAGGLELRKWFASPYPLHGHAIGIYTLYGNYDVRLFTGDEASKGWLSYQSYSAGLSYAYSMPVARRFNLEFGIAFGYVGGRYYRYDYCMTHEHWAQRAVYNRHYFGPTRIGVSLVWLLGAGNDACGKYTQQ